jgi:hypothetical protein
MSPSTVTRPRAESGARWRWLHHDNLAIVVAAVIAIVVTQLLVHQPSRVTVTVVNETPYRLRIEAAAADDDSWAPLLVIEPHHTRDRTGFIDQGEQWRVRFAGQGRDGGEVTVVREEHEADGWRLDVPMSVADELELRGATPPPVSD